MLQQGALTYCWKRKAVKTCISQSCVHVYMCTQKSGRILTAFKLGINKDRSYFSFFLLFFSVIQLSRVLAASCGISHWGARAPECSGSVVVACGLSCSVACWILLDPGSNPCALHRQVDSHPLYHQGSLLMRFWAKESWVNNRRGKVRSCFSYGSLFFQLYL